MARIGVGSGLDFAGVAEWADPGRGTGVSCGYESGDVADSYSR